MRMASSPGTLRVVRTEPAGSATRLLDVERADGSPFVATAGKYIIVHTGVTLPNGKPVKRAYSLMPSPLRPGRCRLAVKRLGDGPGSNALHRAAAGAEFFFSGPWGKLVPAAGLAERAFFVATDTGITSALSVAEDRAWANGELDVLWLCTKDDAFLDVAAVRSRIEARGASFSHAVIPPVSAEGRDGAAWELIEARVASRGPELLLAAGDGAIVHPLCGRFAGGASGIRDVRIECFFHNPEQKSR